jgi:hypothetical protein
MTARDASEHQGGAIMQLPTFPWLKPGIWGMVIGSVVTMIVGFSWLGWTLGSTAEKSAQQRTDVAVTSALTPICVQSFLKQSDATKKLTGLKEIDSWKQSEFVEKGGWATMPGSKEPAQGVASACADALVKTKA